MSRKRVLLGILCVLLYGSAALSAQGTVAVKSDSIWLDNQIPRHLNHPLLMVQGKIPGLIINQDRNPNGEISYRLRGFNRIQYNRPLVIVDGIIESDLDFLDPNSITSVNVSKSLAKSALYGLRGADGVIEIRTNRLESETGNINYIDVNYSSYLASSTKSKVVPVMNRETFLAAGGNDLGANTQWQEEVSRTAFSNRQNLGISGRKDALRYSAKASLEKLEGVLKQSGYERTSFRLGASHSSFDNRLMISANAYSSNRDENRSFVEGFRYATVYNPTAPIRFENGNYWEAILFDNFNPVALIEQNQNEAERDEHGLSISASVQPIEKLVLDSRYSKVRKEDFIGQFYSSNSYFRGLNNNGLAIRTNSESEFQSFRNEVRYSVLSGAKNLQMFTGLNYSDQLKTTSEKRLSDFNGNPNNYMLLDSEANQISVSSYLSPTVKNTTYYVGGAFHSNSVFLESRIRRESYNVLGHPNESDWFGDFITEIDLKEITNLQPLNALTLSFSASNTAIDPGFFGAALSQSIYNENLQREEFNRDPNPDLVISIVSEQSIGIKGSVLDSKMVFGIEYYSRNITDMILEQFIPASESITGAYIRNENALDLKSNGVEASISYSNQFLESGSINTRFVISSSNIKLERYIIDESMRGYPGAPGQGSTQMIRLAVGEKIGQIWGTVFDRVAEEGETEVFTYGGGQTYTYTYSAGEPIFKDLNGDGVKKTAMSQALDVDADFTELGHAYPDFEFGWTNTVFFGDLTAEAHFRGAVGHSKINLNRMFYEPTDQGAINAYNRVQTEKAAEGLTTSYFSSLFVERADFIALDYISLGYTVDMSSIKAVKSIQFSATVEDVFTITNYTGVSPEPVYDGFDPVDNGGFLNTTADPFSPGIDRRLKYLPARTLLLGLNINF